MKKRVETGELKLGMFVCEYDHDWRNSPFLDSGFAIESTDQIKLISDHCKHVYIETNLQIPLAAHSSSVDIMSFEFSHLDRPELELEILKKYAEPGAIRGGYPDRISAEHEIESVREIYRKAVALTEEIFSRARIGKKFDVAVTRKLLANLTDSVIRNPDALICYTKMKSGQTSTAQHGLRCCILALVFGRHLRMEQQHLLDLGLGALLHDIGKSQVPIEILECGHELNEEEKERYRQHVPEGIAILENATGIARSAIDVARYHHERYDLTGLNGNDISEFGHIGNIVNFYDEMTNDYPGHHKTSAHLALKMIYEQRGKIFHPHLAEEFIRCMGIYPIGSIVEMLSGEVGVVVSLNRLRILKPSVAIVLDPASNSVNDPVIVDLVDHRNQHGDVLEISNVLEENAYNFDPIDFLPVHA